MNVTDELKKKVWEKADKVAGKDSNIFRKDQCGAWIKFSDYGNRDSEHGWEIDHITPVSNGGGDELSNLRPLQRKNNVRTSDGRLKCPITAK